MLPSRIINLLFVLGCLTVGQVFPQDNIPNSVPLAEQPSGTGDLLLRANNFYGLQKYQEALNSYGQLLKNGEADSTYLFKKLALSHAALENAKESASYTEKYLIRKFDVTFLVSDGLKNIKDSKPYQVLMDRYHPSFDIWSFLYIYVAFIGFYIVIVINLNKRIDRVARLLIGTFVLIHSIFIVHICLFMTNFQYRFPHTYLMSGFFSFLFGPLLYFYFKRITEQYQFKKKDLLHLLPTVLMLIYLVPVYLLSADDKLQLLLDKASGYNSENSLGFIVVVSLKIISLVVYGIFIRKLYLKSKNENQLSIENRRWQKNIYRIHFLYIIFYSLYGILAISNLTSSLIFNLQIIFMASMVLYVGYSANVQPNVFSGTFFYTNQLFPKYKKSGLTESLSNELKENLIYLFDNEKIYKENDINLDTIAERLNTTRHNASQVINEHFKINFHELVNKYRIQEAKSMLEIDDKHNLNIIDIAYEVGYNNKVTFNKAFKKETNLTPSEYQKVAIGVGV